MLRVTVLGLFLIVLGTYGRYDDKDMRKVYLEGLGYVIGKKYWDSDFYEFMGIPYATQPKGVDKYKAPLPPTPWDEDFEANRGLLICQQVFYSGEENGKDELYGQDDCLVASYMVPKKANENNLVPVIVYVHSGAFAGGNGNMAKFITLARQDVLVISLNYRLGALGFACLGTEEIPGNAALKDIVAALKFIKQHVKTFGGDPDNITLAGYSVGATLAELVALSKESRGLFNKLVLDSGTALAPYAIDRDPIATAKNIATSIGYEDEGDLEDLNDFLIEINITPLLAASRNFFLKNSTFGFAPCIENPNNPGAVLTESPLDTLKRGGYGDFSLLTGFANMEGISRTSQFDNWSPEMNENLANFLPVDLKINNEKERDEFIKELQKYYFHDKPLNHDNVQGYIDYFSDAMFKYSILKSLKLHSQHLKRPIYVFEFTYVGKLNTQHAYMDRIRGASHRDATAYVLDFYDWTRNYTDMDRRDLMNFMWADFLRYENPTAYESFLLKMTWEKYTKENPKYLDMGDSLVMKKDPFTQGYKLWEKMYDKYYWTPAVVDPEPHKVFSKTKSQRKKREWKLADTKTTSDEASALDPGTNNQLPDVDKKPASETSSTSNEAQEAVIEDPIIMDNVKEPSKKPSDDPPTPSSESKAKDGTQPPAQQKPSTESKPNIHEKKPAQPKPTPKNTETPTKPIVKNPTTAGNDKNPSDKKAGGTPPPKPNTNTKTTDSKAKIDEQKPAQRKSSSKNSDTQSSKGTQSEKVVKK